LSILRIAEAYWKRAIATLCVATVFVLLYEIQTRDSKSEASVPTVSEMTVLPQAGARMQFSATAYCKGETTTSGVGVRTGIAAADPAILPVGSVVRLETPNPRYSGVWTVMDTGPAVRGRSVDLYLCSCKEALQFGRRSIRLTVLRLGWSPENSIPGMVDTLFRKREAESKKPAPALPTPPPPAAAPTTTLPSSGEAAR
jgi:3D (Asp-Asp-Asp) domain-containing protein